MYRAVLLLIDFFFIGSAEEVVDGNTVKVGDLDEGFGGDVACAGFVMAVTALGTVQNICHLLLREVFVFSEISDSYILHKLFTIQYTYFTKFR